MATGRLGAVDLSATTNTLVYTGPASTVATVTIGACNRNSTDAVIRVALLDGAIGTLANEDYIEYGLTLNGNGVLERSGVVVGPAQTIVAYSDTANVSVQVWGWEEPT